MAAKEKKSVPDYQEKQKILYIKETPPEKLLEVADRLLEQDRFSDAYDYLERSGDEKKIEEYMNMALDRGDFFNFDRAARKLDIEIEPELWEQLGENAAARDLFAYAVDAYRRAGRRGKTDEIMRANPDFFGPSIEMDREKAMRKGKFVEMEDSPEPDSQQLAESSEDAAAQTAPQPPKKKKKKKRRKRR